MVGKIIGIVFIFNIFTIFYMTPLGALIHGLFPIAFHNWIRSFSPYSLFLSNIIFISILIYKEMPEEYSKK